jgi:hypothetical protein
VIRRPNTEPSADAERLKLVVDIWKHAVDVQMHFNDMGMRIRNLYFTFLAAAIGLIGVIQGKHIHVLYPRLDVHLVLFVIVSLIPISGLFYFLDRHWYHRLLLGAVIHCASIEKKYAAVLPELSLGAAISAASPKKFPSWYYRFWFWLIVNDARYKEKKDVHSDAKIEVLYKSVMLVAFVFSIIYAGMGGIEIDGCSIFGRIVHGACPLSQLP